MDRDDVILATFESALMHMQRVNKRLTILAAISILLALTMFGVGIYFFSTFEVTTEQVTVDSSDGPANYIGNDNNGEINNGFSDSEKDNNQKEKQ